MSLLRAIVTAYVSKEYNRNPELSTCRDCGGRFHANGEQECRLCRADAKEQQ